MAVIKQTPINLDVQSTYMMGNVEVVRVIFATTKGKLYTAHIPVEDGWATSPYCQFDDLILTASSTEVMSFVYDYTIMGYYMDGSDVKNVSISYSGENNDISSPRNYPDAYSGIQSKPQFFVYAVPSLKLTIEGNDTYLPLIIKDGNFIDGSPFSMEMFGGEYTVEVAGQEYSLHKNNADGSKTLIKIDKNGNILGSFKEEVEDPIQPDPPSPVVTDVKDLGLVTAYGAAKEGGYTGTYEEYRNKMLELLNLNLSTLGTQYDDTEIRNQILLLSSNKMDKVTLARVATSGSYSDLRDKPSFASIAQSGEYSDLKNAPKLKSDEDWIRIGDVPILGSSDIYNIGLNIPGSAKEVLLILGKKYSGDTETQVYYGAPYTRILLPSNNFYSNKSWSDKRWFSLKTNGTSLDSNWKTNPNMQKIKYSFITYTVCMYRDRLGLTDYTRTTMEIPIGKNNSDINVKADVNNNSNGSERLDMDENYYFSFWNNGTDASSLKGEYQVGGSRVVAFYRGLA